MSLDVLRAVAIFIVFGRHMRPCPAEESAWINKVTTFWMECGWVGVDLFFVLSGFLVSGLLFQEYKTHGDLQIGRFLLRRGFKIYPPFWLLVGVCVAINISRPEFRWTRVAKELLFIQNYTLSIFAHTWSLAVEEHFYFLLAFMFAALVRFNTGAANPFQRLPTMILVFAVVCLGMRLQLTLVDFNFFRHWAPTHLRIDSLFFGVLLAFWSHFHAEKFTAFIEKHSTKLLLVGPVLLMPAFFFRFGDSFLMTFGFTSIYLGSGVIMLGTLGRPYASSPSRGMRGVAFIGRHSYSIYLWHVANQIFKFDELLSVTSWWAYFVLYIGSGVCIGLLASAIVEWPALRLRDRLAPSRSRSGGVNRAGAAGEIAEGVAVPLTVTR